MYNLLFHAGRTARTSGAVRTWVVTVIARLSDTFRCRPARTTSSPPTLSTHATTPTSTNASPPLPYREYPALLFGLYTIFSRQVSLTRF